jgi:dTDP-4-dehydrorhamnose 3,5-epimerase
MIEGTFQKVTIKKKFEKAIGEISFVQDNESKSSKGVLRGLHFQKPPYAQAKLVRCIEGKVLDVAVDIREGSETFGQHVSVELTGENKKQVFIPRGFAHGFLVLSESAIFAYKVDNSYAPTHDAGIRWDDSLLNIQWGVSESEVLVSEKDAKLPFFLEFETPFTN